MFAYAVANAFHRLQVGIENADPLADDEKRMKERGKFAALDQVKFMLTGMKVCTCVFYRHSTPYTLGYIT